MPGASNLLELVTVVGDKKPYLKSTARKALSLIRPLDRDIALADRGVEMTEAKFS